MMNIKEAKKELKRVGCGRAEGDALRFMYANLIAFRWQQTHAAYSTVWPVPELYKELGKVADDKISQRANEIMANKKEVKNGVLKL